MVFVDVKITLKFNGEEVRSYKLTKKQLSIFLGYLIQNSSQEIIHEALNEAAKRTLPGADSLLME
jgi:hypothetical protein